MSSRIVFRMSAVRQERSRRCRHIRHGVIALMPCAINAINCTDGGGIALCALETELLKSQVLTLKDNRFSTKALFYQGINTK
jgi:hypothetical protein